MKKILYLTVFMFVSSLCMGQEGQISIVQDPRIAELLEIYKSSAEHVNYYRIQIGFGSFEEAQKLKSKVEADFPDWYSKIDFESPSYRVRLGRFRTKLEAERKLMEVRKKYPESMLLKPEKTTI